MSSPLPFYAENRENLLFVVPSTSPLSMIFLSIKNELFSRFYIQKKKNSPSSAFYLYFDEEEVSLFLWFLSLAKGDDCVQVGI